MPSFQSQTSKRFEIPYNKHFFYSKLLIIIKHSISLDLLHLDNFLLRLSCEVISPVLSHIFNLALTSGFVPKAWKTARITPIYKGKGCQKILGNYRPISIMPTFAKLIETHVKSHLLKYLEDHSLLSKLQFAYLSGSSTETALHNIVDNTLMN